MFVIKDLDKHDPKDIQWVEDPHPLFKCVKDPCGKKARTCTSSEKFRIYPHYFHRKDEIELHLLQKNHIKTNIPRGLKLNIVFIPTLYTKHWTLWTICNLGGEVEILFMDPLNNIASSDLRELFKIFVGSIWSNKEALFTPRTSLFLNTKTTESYRLWLLCDALYFNAH